MENNTIWGYCRVSTKSQKLERQVENLIKYEPQVKILKEKYTGTTTDRPVFNKLLKRVKEGDTIIFDSVSRMSRSADEGFEIYKDLFKKGINLVFLNEPHINTSVYAKALGQRVNLGADTELIQEVESFINRVLDILAREQIQIAFNQAENEVKDIQTRVKEGIRTAREKAEENGEEFKIGRPLGSKCERVNVTEIKQKIIKYSKDFNGEEKDKDLMSMLGISRNTYYKYKKELKEVLQLKQEYFEQILKYEKIKKEAEEGLEKAKTKEVQELWENLIKDCGKSIEEVKNTSDMWDKYNK